MLRRPSKMTMSDAELRDALYDANLPTLLVVLTQLTGEQRWLADPYRPSRTRALDDNDDAGLPPERQTEIREAAWEVLRKSRDGEITDPPTPDETEIVARLTACMGEQVPAEEGAMMAEEAGFRSRDAAWTSRPPERLETFKVVVIGAGISGTCASVKLSRLGIDHVVFEKGDRVGGTWRENDYPGAGVDTPSHLYSFSFAQNPGWSRYYAKQPEIHDYLTAVAEQYGVMDNVRFGTEVVSATFDSAARRWHIVTRGPGGTHTHEADAVISSVGQLNGPQIPDIPGAGTFPGPAFHSARWRHDVDLSGKRVAVLGVGASAMQIVPTIAGTPDELLVFQRSPQWVAPNPNYLRPVSDGARLLMEQVPYYAAWYRLRLLWMFNDKLHPTLQIDPDWPHPERSVNAANDKHRDFFTRYLRTELAGREDLVEKLLPTYPPYGKRILMDNNWFATLRRDDVRLVTSDVQRIEGDVLVTADGERHQADVLVYATGFQSRRMLYPMDIRGSDGRSLREVWGDDDARAHMGMTMPGFPNFFVTYGPNTNLGHGGSVMFHTECQINYITRLLATMLEQDIDTLECRTDVHDQYNAQVDAAHEHMIWTHRGMDTWYRNRRGRVVTNTPWRLRDYWAMTREPDLDDFLLTHREAALRRAL
ncbi:flavin-containing monooxygenase [Streptomyces sp. NPDC048425]|uniref:flavin-containing monooxygenase n=1 Tax=Streptomyces sp. NPDC048425 TaxID=3365548 RepID=UPI00371081E8